MIEPVTSLVVIVDVKWDERNHPPCNPQCDLSVDVRQSRNYLNAALA